VSFARRIGVLFALAAALYGERPHWERVQHFVFVLLPRASFDQYFGAYPDSEGRPTAWVAHTVKGKGVSFMENDNNWHYRIPTAEEVARAGKELGQA
jgi:phospholipase C